MKTRKFILRIDEDEYYDLTEVKDFEHLTGLESYGSYQISPEEILVEIISGFGGLITATANISELLGKEKKIFALALFFQSNNNFTVDIAGSKGVLELTNQDLELVTQFISPAIDLVLDFLAEEKGEIPEDLFCAPTCEEPHKN